MQRAHRSACGVRHILRRPRTDKGKSYFDCAVDTPPRQNPNKFGSALGLYYLCPKVKGTGMKKDEGFSVEVESRYEGWWRYNVTILCGCFDADGNRIGFASAESVVAPVGSDLSAPPEGAAAERRIGIRSIACDHIVMYVYIVPHTLPETREIGNVAPFDVRLRIGYGGVPFGDMHYRINQWSGASLEIKLRNDGKPFRA